MKKAETMAMWQGLTENQPIMPEMRPIPYKASGSTYGACGVRVDGTPAFVQAVLSHLKEMISGENDFTRLALAYNEVDGEKLNKSFDNKELNAVCCYIRLHERGNEAQHFANVRQAIKAKRSVRDEDATAE